MRPPIHLSLRSLSNSRPFVKYDFYDLILRTPYNPTEPLEANLMSKKQLANLKKTSKATYEGTYNLDNASPEDRIGKVFGGRIKGEAPTSSSRINIGEPRVIAGVTVPAKPSEPDNCCMSGCINCVWELYNDDVKDWNAKRREAANSLVKKGGRWPENFHAPVQYLKKKNLPLSIQSKTESGVSERDLSSESEAWGNVPVSIRVFAETEKKLKAKKRSMNASVS